MPTVCLLQHVTSKSGLQLFEYLKKYSFLLSKFAVPCLHQNVVLMCCSMYAFLCSTVHDSILTLQHVNLNDMSFCDTLVKKNLTVLCSYNSLYWPSQPQNLLECRLLGISLKQLMWNYACLITPHSLKILQSFFFWWVPGASWHHPRFQLLLHPVYHMRVP